MEKIAQALDSRQLNPSRRFVVKGGDGASIQAGPLRHVRDAQLVATHENGEMAADHFLAEPLTRGVAQRNKAGFCAQP